MIVSKVQRFLVGFLLINSLSMSIACAQMYERFNGSTIAASRWQPPSIAFGAAEQMLIVNRGFLKTQIRAYGNDDTDLGGFRNTPIRLRIPENRVLKSDGSLKLTALQSSVIMRDISMRGCLLPNAGQSQGMFTQFNGWFNDGNSTGVSDLTGDILSAINIVQRDDASNKQLFNIEVKLIRCDTPDCGSSSDLFESDTNFNPVIGTVKLGERVSIRAGINENKQTINITTKVVGQPAIRKKIDYSSVTSRGGSFSTPEFAHSIQTRAQPATCDLSTAGTRRPYVDLSVDVDYVRANIKK